MQKSSKKNSYEPDLYKIGVIFCFISILWLGIFENPSTRDLIYEVKGKSEEQSIRIKELENTLKTHENFTHYDKVKAKNNIQGKKKK